MSYLTAWGLPESKKMQKKVQKRPNLTKFDDFFTEKDIKSKNARRRKKNYTEKGLFFRCIQMQAVKVKVKLLVFIFTKYLISEKIFSLYYNLIKRGASPQPLSFGKRPSAPFKG